MQKETNNKAGPDTIRKENELANIEKHQTEMGKDYHNNKDKNGR